MDERLLERLTETLGATLVRYFHAEMHDAERIPEGGVLLAANHAFLAVDSAPLFTLLHRHTGRYARGLAEKLLFSPVARRLGVPSWLDRVGAVKGTRDNATHLLASDELVLVYPGGAMESLKGPGRSYELRWERSQGFVSVAARAGVPIVPIMGVGIDEAYPALTRERFFARRVIGKSRYDLPLVCGLGPLPFPTKLDFYVGEPFHTRDLDPDDEEAVARAHFDLWQQSQALLDARLRDRGGPGLVKALRARLDARRRGGPRPGLASSAPRRPMGQPTQGPARSRRVQSDANLVQRRQLG